MAIAGPHIAQDKNWWQCWPCRPSCHQCIKRQALQLTKRYARNEWNLDKQRIEFKEENLVDPFPCGTDGNLRRIAIGVLIPNHIWSHAIHCMSILRVAGGFKPVIPLGCLFTCELTQFHWSCDKNAQCIEEDVGLGWSWVLTYVGLPSASLVYDYNCGKSPGE